MPDPTPASPRLARAVALAVLAALPLIHAACGEVVVRVPPPDRPPDPFAVALVTRTFTPPPDRRGAIDAVNASGAARRHVLLQFFEVPDFAAREPLRALGVRILEPVSARTSYASIPAGLDADDPALAGVRWIGLIAPEDKLDPEVARRGAGEWARLPDGRVRLNVVFFGDVGDGEVRRVLAAQNAAVELDFRPTAHKLLVAVAPAAITAFVAEDAVRWVEDADPPPVETNDGSRAWTRTDPVHALGVTGGGVIVGLWDSGRVDNRHTDVAARLRANTQENCPPDTPAILRFSNHATHVAATMAGTGFESNRVNGTGANNGGTPGQWKGHAPDAPQIHGFDFRGNVPGEMRGARVNSSVAVANNSWTFGVGWGRNFDPSCPDPADLGDIFRNNQSHFGDYRGGAPEYDEQVRSGLTIVFAAGNDRNDAAVPAATPIRPVPPADFDQAGVPAGIDKANVPQGYYTLAPPGTAKNVVTVGAIKDGQGGQAGGDALTDFTAWGPTDDGRTKPDLVAPGFRIKSAMVVPDKGYGVKSGTSMAAPAVSGISALVVQDCKRVFGRAPRPSTVKAALICPAVDLGRVGPDFQYGWGKVDAQGSIDLVRARGVVEDSVRNAETDRFPFKVKAGTERLRVTLVWDDPKVAEGAATTLRNDLDLVLVDPAGGRHLPWLLDPAKPAQAAGRGADRRNNVEQVQVDRPRAGRWVAEVTGSTVPEAPQRYALCAPPPSDLGDAPDRGVPRDYPTLLANAGARHADYRFEWLGTTRGREPSASFESDAIDPFDEDGRDNLIDGDDLDDGVDLPDSIVPGRSYRVTVRVATTIADTGFGPEGRYQRGEPTRRLYLNAWADWANDGAWLEPGDKILGTGSPFGTVVFDPETFGPNGLYTLGESFDDVGLDGVAGSGDAGEGNGLWDEGEPFADVAGRSDRETSFDLQAPPGVGREVWFRFRLDYGEDVGRIANPTSDPGLEEETGTARFGEVEDYRRPTFEIDEFAVTAARMQIESAGGVETVVLSGPTTIEVEIGGGGETGDRDGDGRDDVPTEIVEMELTGASSFGWITARVRDPGRHPFQRSAGEIEERRDVAAGRLDLAPFCDATREPACAGAVADSFFDVYFEIETPGGRFHSHQPKHMESEITFKPPRDEYQSIERIPLFDEDENPLPIAITGVAHLPQPPEEQLEVLRWIELLRSPEPGSRLEAAEALRALGPRAAEAAPALRLLTRDSDPRVAAAARRALAVVVRGDGAPAP